MKPMSNLLACLLILAACATAYASGQSLADGRLTRDALGTIKLFENAQRVNGTPKVIGKKIIQRPDIKGVWLEQWTIKRRDKQVDYDLRFVPSPSGGTNVGVSMHHGRKGGPAARAKIATVRSA